MHPDLGQRPFYHLAGVGSAGDAAGALAQHAVMGPSTVWGQGKKRGGRRRRRERIQRRMKSVVQ